MPTARTTCALCESRCGLLAEVHGDRVVGLKPDPDHPVSRGHACVKGLHFHRIHHHPERVLRPLLRDGSNLVPTGWEAALSEIGGRIQRAIAEHGAHAVGLYSGNAAGHSFGAVMGVAALQRGLGTRRHYSCLTLDNSPQFVVQEEVFGAAMRTFAADFAEADAILLVGTDPLSSQCSQAQSNPRGVGHLHAAGRAGRLWVVDPRASRTARAGRHLPARPGSDVALLGWLLAEALSAGRGSPEIREGDREQLGSAVARFDLERAATATGLDRSALLALRGALLEARRPLVWSGLGVLLGAEGTVGHWLVTCLMAVLGGLAQRGGWALPRGFDLAPLARRIGLRARNPAVRGRSGHPAVMDTLAAADLAADIEDGALRALVVVGGNPLLALPDRARSAAALEKLELLVCLDLFVNDTGTLAHAVLPVRGFLGRSDLPLHLAGQRWADGAPVRPVLEPAVVRPPGEARGDFEILADLALAAGRRPFGIPLSGWLLRRGPGPVRLASMVAGRLGGGEPRLSLHRDGKVHLAVPELLEALAGWELDVDGLRLVTSVRPVETLNHWMHGARAARRREAVASVHPATLARLGLEEGPGTVISDEGGVERRVSVALVADASLREDVVVLPFGWGHRAGAIDVGGAAANGLVSADRLEAFTGQPRSNGIRVRLAAADVG